MTDMISAYYQHATTQLQRIVQHESEAIHQTADAIATALMNDLDFLTFGSGHSELVAKEAMWRAGGLAPALAIHDHTGGDAERFEGMAAVILGHYVLRQGSVLVVISNSGINPVPIEAAMLGNDNGLTTVAITSVEHSKNTPTRHSSGNRLLDVVDIVIDTHTPIGDIALTLPDSSYQVGATSTFAGIFIMQSIIASTAAKVQERGGTPPVLLSANVVNGDEHNTTLKNKYLPRLVRYAVDMAEIS